MNRQINHQSLVTNCSSFTLTDAQDRLLSRGLNFVPTPKSVNKSLILARWQRFVRTVRWKEFWHGKSQGEATAAGPKTVFKKLKSNLPPYNPPRHLNTFIQASRDDVLLAPLNEVHPNLPKEEQEAMKELMDGQKRGEYKVLPNDKSGGVTVVDLADYKLVVQEQLSATYTGEDGTQKPYYRNTCIQHLQHLRSKAQELVEEGVTEKDLSTLMTLQKWCQKMPNQAVTTAWPRSTRPVKDGLRWQGGDAHHSDQLSVEAGQ